MNGQHRLYLLQCFFGALFTGNNRFIYGLGFTNTSTWLCEDVGLHEGLTHAQNMFAQVAADNGFFALLGLGVICILLMRRSWQLTAWYRQPVTIVSVTSVLYIFLSLQIEGGWSKATFLQAMIGTFVGSLTMHPLHRGNSQ